MCLIPKHLLFSFCNTLWGAGEGECIRKKRESFKKTKQQCFSFIFLPLLLFVHSFSPGPHFSLQKTCMFTRRKQGNWSLSQIARSENTEVRKPLWMASSFSMAVLEISWCLFQTLSALDVNQCTTPRSRPCTDMLPSGRVLPRKATVHR